MNTKRKLLAAVAVVLAFATTVVIQQRTIERLRANNLDLRSQLAQLTSLQERNEAIAQQLKTAAASADANQSELLRLRGQSSKLKGLERENAMLKSQTQQLATQLRQSQAAATQGDTQAPIASAVRLKPNDTTENDATDLGPLELQSAIPVQFDLGGGTNCIVTPTALPDGNTTMDIKVGVTNSDGTFKQLGESRLTARPGQQCSISVGDRMIALAVTIKP